MKKRILSMVLALAICLNPLSTVAFAESGQTVCPHHSHNEGCGYTEGTPGTPCAHQHADDCYTIAEDCVHIHLEECYPQESVSGNTDASLDEASADPQADVLDSGAVPLEAAPDDAAPAAEGTETQPTACTHVCGEESGCVVKALVCPHVHDSECGYVAATEGTPCTFDPATCEICHPLDSAVIGASGDECVCETACTEDTMNAECPVCGAEGAALENCGPFAAEIAAYENVVALFEALPAPESITAESTDAEREAVHNQVGEFLAAYEALSDANKEKFTAAYGDGYALIQPLVNAIIGDVPMALADNVSYIDANGQSQTQATATDMTASTTTWGTSDTITWYVVNSNVSITGTVSLNGNVNLILKDSSALTITGSIYGDISNGTLTIYGQSGGTGTLTVNNSTPDNFNTYSALNVYDGITINGGTVNATATGTGFVAAIYSEGGTVAINGGTVTAEATDTDSNSGSVAYAILGDSVSITGGTVKATASSTNGDARGFNCGAYGAINISGGTTIVNAQHPFWTTPTTKTNCIIFEDTTGTFYGTAATISGKVTLPGNLTIASGQTLTIPVGASLTVPQSVTLTNNGTIDNKGTITNNGTINNTDGTITAGGTVNGTITGNQPGAGSTTPTEYGDFVVTGDSLDGVSFANNVLTISSGDVTVQNKTDVASATNRIVVAGGSVTLDGVNIKLSGAAGAVPLTIESTCTLTLVSNNQFSWDKNEKAEVGILIQSGTTTITGNGFLFVSGNGISAESAALVVNGSANVEASSINCASLTVSGNSYVEALNGIEITNKLTVSGGDVVAGNDAFADITADSIEVSGGSVTAKNITAGTVEISSGKMTAQGGDITATTSVTISGGTVEAQNITGKFSTGTNGNAVIIAASITDQSGKASWKGVIFENGSGRVYGNVTLQSGADILDASTLVIPAGASLDLGGYSMNYSGTLLVKDANSLANGTLGGTGNYYYIPDITVADLYYTGSALAPNPTFTGTDFEFSGKQFTKFTEWGDPTYTPDTIVDAGNYKVSYTNSEYGVTIEKEFTVQRSGTTFDPNGVKTYNAAGAETTAFTYGDTITVKVTPEATGAAKTRALTAPTANQMAVFADNGTTQLSEAVSAGVDGSYTMTIKTAEVGLDASNTAYTLIAKYVGDANMADHSQTFSVTITKADQAALTIDGKPEGNIVYGDTFILKVEGGSTNGAVTWEVTEGSSFASVDNDGKVTITGVGKVTITATRAGDTNYKQASATYTFTSKKATPDVGTVSKTSPTTIYDTTALTSITLSRTNTTVSGTLALDAEQNLTVGQKDYNWTFKPTDTTNYNEVKGTIELEVTADTLQSIAVTTPPTKTTYIYGETFNRAGMVVTATYASSNTIDVTTDVEIAPVTLTVPSATLTITYEGKTTTQAITVNPKVVDNPTIELAYATHIYTGEALEPTVTVKDNGKVIPSGEYTVEYGNNTNAGTATVTIKDAANGNYTVSGSADFSIAAVQLTSGHVTLTIPDGGYTYDKAEKKPDVTVQVNGKTLTSGTDYEVTYSNNTNAGENTAKVTVTGKGNYAGTVDKTFTIGKATVTPAISGTTTKTYDGNNTATGLSITLAGIVSGDDVTATATSYTYNSANVKEAHTITATGIALEGTAAANYQLSSTTATIAGTITKATSATAPTAGEGYTLNYTAETITVKPGYEVSTAETSGTAVPTGSITGHLSEAEKTLYIRKVEDDNHAASGWTAFTLAARPAAPSLTPKDETLKGQGNGELPGIDSTMEYSLNGGAWTDGSADLTGLAGGTTIKVRFKATDAAPHGTEIIYTIKAGATITVTFVENGQTATEMPAQQTGLSYGTKLTKPTDYPVAVNTDFAFRGWFKEAAGTTEWNFGVDTLQQENTTLYAKWEQVYFSVDVEVKDNQNNPYNNATVKLMRGADTIDTITSGTNGSYAFSKHVEAGMYNIMVIYTDDDGTHTKTELVEIKANTAVSVTLPPPGVNSHLDVSPDADTPAVMVGGLDKEAEALKTDGVSKVTVSMAVEGQQKTEVETAVVTAIDTVIDNASSSGVSVSTPVVEYLDISMTKQINQGAKQNISETTNVIELVIPFVFDGKTANSIIIVRYHGSTAEKLTQADSKAEGTYQLNTTTGYIHIYTQKFSTYAIAYTLENGYTITFDAGEGSVTDTTQKTGTDGKLDSLPTPTRSGYNFDGWFTADGAEVTTDTVFRADTEIIAKWTKKSDGKPTDSKPSGGDDSGDSDSYRDDEYDFWQDVRDEIEDAASGDVVKANARGYDRMPWRVMEALRENSGVALVIKWNGGEDIIIPAGKALQPESGRIYYPLSYLADLFKGMTLTNAAGQVIDPNKLNPDTGGDMLDGGKVQQLEAPAIADTITKPDGDPEITNPQRGLAETPELAEKGVEQAIPGVYEPEAAAENAPPAGNGGPNAFLIMLVAAAAVMGGGWIWRKRRTKTE